MSQTECITKLRKIRLIKRTTEPNGKQMAVVTPWGLPSSEHSFILYAMNTMQLQTDAANQGWQMCQANKLAQEFDLRPPKNGSEACENQQWSLCIVPRSARSTKVASNMVAAHLRALTKMLDKYKKGSLSSFHINFVVLANSYVKVVATQILGQKCAKDRRLQNRRALQKDSIKVVSYFWKRYFIFQESSNIDEFIAALQESRSKIRRNHNEIRLNDLMVSGIWLDTYNGVLIFGTAKDKISVLPCCGFAINETDTQLITNKIMLFVNMALLQCIQNQV